MPQVQVPMFPAGSVEINRDLACRTEGEQVVYCNWHLPVFTHGQSDLASFRMFTSQLTVQGSATQGQVAKAFGAPLVAIKRGSKLNAERLEQARALLVQGHPLAVVSLAAKKAERTQTLLFAASLRNMRTQTSPAPQGVGSRTTR